MDLFVVVALDFAFGFRDCGFDCGFKLQESCTNALEDGDGFHSLVCAFLGLHRLRLLGGQSSLESSLLQFVDLWIHSQESLKLSVEGFMFAIDRFPRDTC